jgi:type IV secretion system T-DNA border endonuclease VirD2
MALEDDVWEAVRPPFRPTYKADSNMAFATQLGQRSVAKTGQGERYLSAADARAQLARIVNRTPDVLVKVTGRPKGGGHTNAHLAYISRHGKLGVETRDGEYLTTRQEIAERADEWSDDAAWRKTASVSSVSMVFSMPEGTDPESVLGAVRALAYRELGDNHDYVMALHTDTERPHVHLAVQAQGDDRRRFNPGREQLFSFREQFALELRKRGIEASATPRRARGVGRAGSSMALRQIRDRYVIGAGAPAREDLRAAQHSVAVIRGQASHPPFVDKAKARWEAIRGAYANASAALLKSDNSEDRALGKDLAEFSESHVGMEMTPETLVRTYQKQVASIEGVNKGDASQRVPDPNESSNIGDLFPKTPPIRSR